MNFRLGQSVKRHACQEVSIIFVPLARGSPCRACLAVSQARRAGRDRYVCGRFAPVDKFDKTRNRSLLTGANRYSDRFIRRISGCLVSPCSRSGSSATDIGFSITSALTEISRLRRAPTGLPSSTISRLDRSNRVGNRVFSVDLPRGNKVTEPWKTLHARSRLIVKYGNKTCLVRLWTVSSVPIFYEISRANFISGGFIEIMETFDLAMFLEYVCKKNNFFQ